MFKLAKIHAGAPPWSIWGYMSDAPAFTLAAFLSAWGCAPCRCPVAAPL